MVLYLSLQVKPVHLAMYDMLHSPNSGAVSHYLARMISLKW